MITDANIGDYYRISDLSPDRVMRFEAFVHHGDEARLTLIDLKTGKIVDTWIIHVDLLIPVSKKAIEALYLDNK